MTGKDLRMVFMGTPEFARENLRSLIENGYNVVAVVTAPDKPAGRGQKINQSAIKHFALERGLPVLQPEKLKDEAFISDLRSFKADLQVVVAFRMLPEVVWNMPPLGTINLHGSLLPKYRGAAPLNWPIIYGETETGLTTFLLKQEIDTGNILFQEKIQIGPEDTFGDLLNKAIFTGPGLLIKTIDALAEGKVNPISQDTLPVDPDHLYAPKIFREHCKIDWYSPGEQIRNLIRGLSPHPTAWSSFIKDKYTIYVKIFKSDFEPSVHNLDPGIILTDQKKFLKIACSNGFIHAKDLQLAGKKRMEIAEFLKGFPNAAEYKAE